MGEDLSDKAKEYYREYFRQQARKGGATMTLAAIYTHVGRRAYVGSYAVTADAIRTPGKVHALNPREGHSGQYKALCGTIVHLGSDDHFQHDDPPNVVPTTPGHRITCKRCRAALDRKTY